MCDFFLYLVKTILRMDGNYVYLGFFVIAYNLNNIPQTTSAILIKIIIFVTLISNIRVQFVFVTYNMRKNELLLIILI